MPDAEGPSYQVRHRTRFEYATPVSESVNTLHLEPRTFPLQKTLSSFVRVMPPTRIRRVRDLFENITHHFEIPAPHRRLEIESRVRVRNLPLELNPTARSAGLDEIRHADVQERVWNYLQESHYVSRPPELWRQAVDLTDGIDAVYEKSLALMQWIHREFRYESGSTRVTTQLEESFAMKQGVCQDFTHVMLGLCRSVGIPARYASGYIYNGPQDHLVGAQASHAWAEVYLPTVGWVGFDPTNDTLADDRYIKVAIGRDYEDVAPVIGHYRGTGHCRMEVSVVVERLG